MRPALRHAATAAQSGLRSHPAPTGHFSGKSMRDRISEVPLALLRWALLALGFGAAILAPAAAGAQTQPTSWKALLVAADYAQPVFNNAVDAIQQRLMAFGMSAADISVLKADARSREAIANRSNVETQSKRLTGPASTGCFFFITSHGQPGGGLIVRRPNAVIRPSQLDQMLDRGCGDRPTVVITSGCFSGLYTEDRAMRRPNRIILAAARADLPSFGCGASERYTFYDRCLLESLKRGAPWQVIASSVNACVSQTERRSGDPPSYPQAFFGSKAAGLTAF